PWRSLALVVSLAGALGTAGVLSRQSATPPPGVTVPDPSECRVEPRTEEDVRDLVSGTPAATPEAYRETRPDALPTGVPADPATLAEVDALMREIIACANAYDVLRLFALTTDGYFVSSGLPDPMTLDAMFARTPTPFPVSERISLVEVRDVLTLADGRIVAVVTRAGGIKDSHPSPGRTDLVYFVRADGRLLLDQTIDQLILPEHGAVFVADAVATQDALGTPGP
ncbi:MAG: hypothetical protein M3462_03470, partial [Chloroflexota bacterium]|nr:hypothetical protein [Chloroflexota bacterium]